MNISYDVIQIHEAAKFLVETNSQTVGDYDNCLSLIKDKIIEGVNTKTDKLSMWGSHIFYDWLDSDWVDVEILVSPAPCCYHNITESLEAFSEGV